MIVTGSVGDGRAAWRAVKELQPDIVVMDISMPDMSGAEATERIKRDFPNVKTIALTAYEEHGYISQMLEAGASGYVLKLAAAEELIKAIRLVAAGGAYLDPTVASKIVTSYARQKAPKSNTRGNALTGREEEILRLVARGYVNKEIAHQLGISVKTVETHKTNFMEKLELASRAETVRYALNRGWLQEK
jgi:DNA-binding NarL/FixJ family response regulator